jgi:alkylation response protein AidB-like acyl-CoA dehydrogenase
VKDLSATLPRLPDFPQEIPSPGLKKACSVWLSPGNTAQGLNYVGYALAQMELAQACPASALILHVNHTLFGGTVAQFGTTAQKEAWLPEVARGEVMACFALTEPEAGSDPAAMKSAARREKDGWILTGGKNFVTSGGEARFALVAAVTEPGQGAKESAPLLWISCHPGDHLGKPGREIGLGLPLRSPSFCEAHLPEVSLLGDLNKGLTGMLSALDGARGLRGHRRGVGPRLLPRPWLMPKAAAVRPGRRNFQAIQ